MPAPQNIGDAFNRVGQWASDTIGLSGAKKVTPGYTIDYGQMNEDRANQMALYQQLSQMAAGKGPSLAQGQLQQATDQNVNQAMALGAAQQGQGMGYAGALRGIADQSAAARQNAAGQSAMIRNAEQMQGMQGMGALGGQMYGQDMARQQLGAGNAYQYDAMNANIDAQNAAGRRQFFGGVINAAGGLLGGGMGQGGGGLQQGGGMGAPDISEPIPMADGGVVADPKMRHFADYLRRNYQSAQSRPGLTDAELLRMESETGHRTDQFVRSAPKNLYARGGPVPGYAMGGALDSRKNDTVPSMLSPGEIVLPRSVTMAPDAAERARAFVEAVQQRRKAGPPQSEQHAVRDAMRKRKAA